MFDKKATTLNLVLKLQNNITPSHIFRRPMAPYYHTLSLVINQKIFSVTTLNLVPKLLKSYYLLAHFKTSYHALSHLNCHI